MDRLASRLTAAGALVFAFRSPAAGQNLPTLHVRNFTLSADRAAVRVGERFHLTLSAHVDEALLELDNVTLPDLSGFEVLGDERRCGSSARGSDCTETLTVEATVAGERTIPPATMEAIDARNRKPSAFLTNSLRLKVGDAAFAGGAMIHRVSDAVAGALRGILAIALVGLAVCALFWGFGRRAKPAAPAPREPPVPTRTPPPLVDPAARLRGLVERLAAEPTRERAAAVRAELRASLGAGEEETLADLVARDAAASTAPRLAALAAVERAVFCEERRVAVTVQEALPLLRV